jgi:predicted acetyltransferase
VLLRPLAAADEQEVRLAQAELLADDFHFLLDERDGESWPAYVKRVASWRDGAGLSPGHVPSTFLVAEVDGQIAGRVSIRHELSAWLSEFGGHIGYGVRPAFRRRGHATEILRQALLIAREVGVASALITCDEDNVASAATIEACGGRFDRLAEPVPGEPPLRRYWVPT